MSRTQDSRSQTPTETSEDPSGARPTTAAAPEALALIVAWSSQETDRVGDISVVPPSRKGVAFVFGRGSARGGDATRRLDFIRSRAGLIEPRPPFASPRISRSQLSVRPVSIDSLEVENIGRCPLRHNGVRVESAVVLPGDTLQLGQDLLLVCVRRRAWVHSVGAQAATIPFGAADPFGLVGESPALWELRRQIAFVAPRVEHTLIVGASGTGKELSARGVHALSKRRDKPFVARNAATFPEGLVDAELFGHARNYPNQGMPERSGLVGEAREGTLFLDEIAELSPALQTHLLRVLDSGEYQRLGDPSVRVSNFRLIAATNRPEQLRDDLRARLKLSLTTPGLNERIEDVPLLVAHLLRRIAASNPDIRTRIFPEGELGREPYVAIGFMDALIRRNYTTHLRELEGLLWQALTATSEGPVGERLPAPSGHTSTVPPHRGERRKPPTGDDLRAALTQNDWVAERTWRALGLANRHVLARLMAKHGLKKPPG